MHGRVNDRRRCLAEVVVHTQTSQRHLGRACGTSIGQMMIRQKTETFLSPGPARIFVVCCSLVCKGADTTFRMW